MIPVPRWTDKLLRAAIVLVGCATAGIALWALEDPGVARLATENPETTAFIERYQARAAWFPVPSTALAPHLKLAVLVAEDIGFYSHQGFAPAEMRIALKEAIAEGAAPRGASTITQQLAKNLWLSPSRNPIRKLREAVLTWRLERVLSKDRILALYLNVVEFGPGIYGAEAAARTYFGVAAAELTPHQSALLAASLSRPASWNPRSESRAYHRRVSVIEERMGATGFLIRRFGIEPPLDSIPPP